MYLYYNAVVYRALLAVVAVLGVITLAAMAYVAVIYDGGKNRFPETEQLVHLLYVVAPAMPALVALIFWIIMDEARRFMASLFDAIAARQPSSSMEPLYESKAIKAYAREQSEGQYRIEILYQGTMSEYIVQRDCIKYATERGGRAWLGDDLRKLGHLMTKHYVDA